MIRYKCSESDGPLPF